MLTDLLIPAGAALHLVAATRTAEGVQVVLTATTSRVPCSTCQVHAHRVHSHYQRTVADLPLAQLPVRLRLQVRRFYCDNPACSHQTFSEPVPALTVRYARRTLRLAAEQCQLGLDVGGAVGARTAQRQGMPVSAATILRLVRHTERAERATPTKLGVDDFAFRKGRRYGTILVDLEQHRPIDLLPDRTAATLEKWLQEHPGVEIIARDRASDYADGAARGAPDAVQVADRFHLLQNAREMWQRLLERHQAALRAATTMEALTAGALAPQEDHRAAAPAPQPVPPEAAAQAEPSAPAGPAATPPPPTGVAPQSQQRREERLVRYQAVQELQAAGHSRRAIAAQLHLGRHTVRRLAVADEFPERATRRPVPSKLDAFLPYLQQQLAGGQDNGMELWRQLRDQYGYRGSRALVSRWVARHRDLCPAPAPEEAKPRRRGHPPIAAEARAQPAQRRCSARQAAFLLIRRSEDLDTVDQDLVERLCAQNPELQLARSIIGEFLLMVRERQGERLEEWLGRAAGSGIAEIGSFVAGIRRDQAAVLAGLTLTYSSGQVEGQVNRLKFIKRSGYGRAKFDLLRLRVLAA